MFEQPQPTKENIIEQAESKSENQAEPIKPWTENHHEEKKQKPEEIEKIIETKEKLGINLSKEEITEKETAETAKEVIKNSEEREPKKAEFLSVLEEFNSLSELISDGNNIGPETAIEFNEKTQQILAKLEKLKDLKISPSEQIRVAKTESYLGEIGHKMTEMLNYSNFDPIFDAGNDTFVTLSHFLTNGEFAFTKDEIAELKHLQFNLSNTPEEEIRLRELNNKGEILKNEFLEMANFPYDTYEPFVPEKEIKKIRKFSPEEQNLSKEDRSKLKQDRLENFKEELSKQQSGIAQLQIEILKTIRKKDNFDAKDLMPIVDKTAPEFRLNPKQIYFFKNLIDECVKKHKTVKNISEKYPKDEALFENLFGEPPIGDIDVIEGPVTLYFSCQNPEDYARIYSYELRNNKLITEKEKTEEIEKANKSGGVKIYYEDEALRDCIIAGNAERHSPTFSREVQKHEEQHALNTLINEKSLEAGAEYEIDLAKNHTQTKEACEKYLKCRRKKIDLNIKNEILAYYREKREPIDDNPDNPRYIKIFKILTQEEKDGGLYDFYHNPDYAISREIPSNILNNLKTKGVSSQEIDEIRAKLFSDESYQTKVINYLHSIKDLEAKGYSQGEIIHLLNTDHPDQWPKIAKRIPTKLSS